MEAQDEVNRHYLDHVVATSETHLVEASEDILAGNGMKLLAKGARIDANVRERLLSHKLRKPLEECVRVTGGINLRLSQAAEQLLQTSDTLQQLCGSRAEQFIAAMRRVKLTQPVESLLTVYCEHRSDKLNHAVTVCLLAQSLAASVMPNRPEEAGTLVMAGLLHDVGELYIDPAFLAKGVRLAPEQWRHIVTHPIVAHRLLKDMHGAGIAVAHAVLQHHERLDGFGYPLRLQADKFTMTGQVLATAELLVGLIESGHPRPLSRASIAMKLIPGEFGRPFINAIATSSNEENASATIHNTTELMLSSLPRVQRIQATLQRFRAGQETLIKQMGVMSDKVKPVIAQGMDRLKSIQVAFSSTGMDAAKPEELIAQLCLQPDPHLHMELTTILREIEWRLKELERESMLRTQLASPAEWPAIEQLIHLMKGKTTAPAQAL